MKQSRAIKLAYMAGFFDGEGCITIVKMKKEGFSPYHQLVVSASQKYDGTVIDWIIGNFGGSCSKVTRDDVFCWRLSARKAYEFLKDIEPFLKYKRPQAQLAIKYQERLMKQNRLWGRNRVSDHELSIREQYYEEMKRLKRVTSNSIVINERGAAVTTKCVDLQTQDAIV